MNIPFLELKPGYLELKDQLDEAYHRFMDSGWYVLGQEVDGFESEYASYCGSRECVGVATGLDALSLALEAAGIKCGDEVIVPSNTYIATWLAVSRLGATPVPVEPVEGTCNIDPLKAKECITDKTTAIIPVHLYGQPADMTEIMKIAEKHRLFVLEDNAQSQGALWEGRRTGSLGHAAAHSFYPGKNLGAFGEGGAVTTSDPDLAEKVRLLRNYGSKKKYYNEVKGYNFRIDGLQAAFLRVKLSCLDEWNERRKSLAEAYLKGINQEQGLQLPEIASGAVPVWHLFTIRHPKRDKLQEFLSEKQIGSMIHYPIPPHLSDAYKEDQDWGSLPIATEIAKTTLSLPIGPHLSGESVYQVIDQINSWLRSN